MCYLNTDSDRATLLLLRKEGTFSFLKLKKKKTYVKRCLKSRFYSCVFFYSEIKGDGRVVEAITEVSRYVGISRRRSVTRRFTCVVKEKQQPLLALLTSASTYATSSLKTHTPNLHVA